MLEQQVLKYIRNIHIGISDTLKVLVILSLVFYNVRGFGQSPLSLYSSVSEEKWLPSNSVRVIFQDSRGFMWVGTNSGLFKYNLSAAVNYNLTQKSSGRLLNNTIYAIAEDTYGNIFVGTESGLGIIDPNTGECSIMSSTDETITKILAGKNNLLWITTLNGNVYRVLARPFKDYKKAFQPLITVKERGKAIGLNTVFEMPDGNILLGAATGIFQLDLVNQKAIATGFKEPVTRIFSYDYRHLYVGTERTGLYLLTFSEKGSNMLNRRKVVLDEAGEDVRHVVNVSGIGKQYIITATSKEIFAARKINDLHSFKKITPPALRSMVASITYLYVDRTANIWVGSTRGLFKIKRHSLNFHYFETGAENGNIVYSLLNDGRGRIWIATSESGLLASRQGSGVLQQIPFPYKVRILKKASNGTIIGIAGQDIIQLAGKNIVAQPRVKKLAPTVASVQDMLEVSPGEWWLASWKDGLVRYLEDGKTDSISLFQEVKKQVGKEVPVFCLMKDSRQRIWIGTRGKGVYRVDPATNEIRHFYKKSPDRNYSDRILCIYEDSKKRVWIGTRGDGLIKYDPESDKFSAYGLSNGLPSNSICFVQENVSGQIWVSTLNGIAVYKPGYKIEFQAYNIEDGIGSAEFSFNTGAAGDNGEVYFANGSGFYSFRKNNSPSSLVFPSVFTSFRVYSKGRYAASAEMEDVSSRLFTQILSKRKVVLDHQQNSFEIGFAALDFTNPEKNRYLYRLMGLDSTWKFIQGAKITVPIFDLPSGEYVFQVLSSNSQGEWTQNPVSVNIEVRPYIWLSTPAYIFYALLVLGGIAAGWYFVTKWYGLRKQIQQEREFAQKQSQQMVLYADLSHEIKNRLSLILGPLELALADKRVNRVLLNNLYNQAQRLKRLTDQILNIRKTETGSFILNVSEENIDRLIKRLYDESLPLARIKNIEFTLTRVQESMKGWCDGELLEIIVLNLLGNAIKYVNVEGKVALKIQSQYHDRDDLPSVSAGEGNYLTLTISNSGEGIRSEEIHKVTRLFYRASGSASAQQGGAGVGLNLVSRLVGLHHGFMQISSEPGVNTTVTVQLPLEKFHYAVSELKPSMISAPIILPKEGLPDGEHGFVPDEIPFSGMPLRKRRVLVVDDQPELATLVKNCLQSEFEVYTVENGRSALEILSQMSFDLIISDLVMPEMDGLTLCLNVRAVPSLKDIPFVILTGRNSEEQKLVCFQNGVDDVIDKPFSCELLNWKVKSMLRPFNDAAAKKGIVVITPGSEPSGSPGEAFIQKIVNMIEENLDKNYLDADFLAEKSFMSRATFYRKMETLVGESPSVFIRKYRLQKAAKLLQTRHYNISSVAQKVGYKDPKYFSKSFQKEFGQSPSEFLESSPADTISH